MKCNRITYVYIPYDIVISNKITRNNIPCQLVRLSLNLLLFSIVKKKEMLLKKYPRIKNKEIRTYFTNPIIFELRLFFFSCFLELLW
jgi:hypothetical protein